MAKELWEAARAARVRKSAYSHWMRRGAIVAPDDWTDWFWAEPIAGQMGQCGIRFEPPGMLNAPAPRMHSVAGTIYQILWAEICVMRETKEAYIIVDSVPRIMLPAQRLRPYGATDLEIWGVEAKLAEVPMDTFPPPSELRVRVLSVQSDGTAFVDDNFGKGHLVSEESARIVPNAASAAPEALLIAAYCDDNGKWVERRLGSCSSTTLEIRVPTNRFFLAHAARSANAIKVTVHAPRLRP